MKNQTIVALSLLGHLIISLPSAYSDTGLGKELSQPKLAIVESVVGSYTDEDLQAALDDYFQVSPLEEATLKIVERVDGIFRTDQITQIDAGMHSFIFDNGLTRKDKLAALFAVFQNSGGNSNKQKYILDTLSAFKPIELTEVLIEKYRGCGDIECARSILTTLESASSLGSVGYTRLQPDQLRYTSFMTEKIYALAEQETRPELLPLVQGIVGDEKAETIHNQLPLSLETDSEVRTTASKSIVRLLGSAELTEQGVALVGQKLEETQDLEQRQWALNTIYSAVRELPLSIQVKKSLKPLLERYGPQEASADNLIGYVEWLRAYASVSSLANDGTEAYRSVFRKKFVSGTVNTKMALLLYGSDNLVGLTAKEKGDARAVLLQYAEALPDSSPEKKKRKAVVSNFDRLMQ